MSQSSPKLGARERNRRQTFETAISLFRRQGFEETSVDEIAESAGTCRRTFFNHFPTKEHILALFHREATLECLHQAERETAEDGWLRLEAAFRAFGRWVMKEPVLGRALLRVMFGSKVLLEQDEKDVLELGNWLGRQLRAAMADGTVRDDLDLELTLALLIGILSSGATQWVLREDDGRALDRDFGAKLRLVMKGLENR